MTMSCEEIQRSLSLYVDDGLMPDERASCYEHLEVCPVCRARMAQMRSIRGSLAMLSHPSSPADLIPSINMAVAAEAAAQRARRNATTLDVINDLAAKWLAPRLMRYAFSSLTSIIIFACVFAALRPHMIALHEASLAFEQMQITPGPDEFLLIDYDITRPISPESYAALRTPFNTESPSLNPAGALATLKWEADQSHRNNRHGDDDMMIVADVFTNGSASLADVMQAPRDRRMLDDFEKALRKDAAFVPAALDRRPETMRVVFSVQRVDVHDRQY
jgi:hypothetical protein